MKMFHLLFNHYDIIIFIRDGVNDVIATRMEEKSCIDIRDLFTYVDKVCYLCFP